MNTAVVLAAGRGTRLGSVLSALKPKCMHEVHSRPILWYVIKLLLKNGFKVVVMTGYKSDVIHSYVSTEFDNVDCVDTGDSVGIGLGLERLKNKYPLHQSSNICIFNADNIFDINLVEAFEHHKEVSFVTSSFQLKFGTFVDDNGSVQFRRNDDYSSLTSEYGVHYAYTGIAMINSELLYRYDLSKLDSFEKDFYNILASSYNTNVVKVSNIMWHAIDTSYELALANNDLSILSLKENLDAF